MLLRVRLTSFLSGFGAASAVAFWQLHNDINSSNAYLAAQAQEARDSLEARVTALEVAVLSKKPAAAPAAAAAAAPAGAAAGAGAKLRAAADDVAAAMSRAAADA
ncbi:MAG: hypothetical protein J3K34DRAFT_519112 [Monoraphidium minutum]|nr:MAG: hypothetical protein J3K34DRAFT_519112 [Monoraphidium minutum]